MESTNYRSWLKDVIEGLQQKYSNDDIREGAFCWVASMDDVKNYAANTGQRISELLDVACVEVAVDVMQAYEDALVRFLDAPEYFTTADAATELQAAIIDVLTGYVSGQVYDDIRDAPDLIAEASDEHQDAMRDSLAELAQRERDL